MKKFLIILVLLLVGCSNNYSDFVSKAKRSNESNDLPFKVELFVDDSDDILIYQVVIDDIEYDLNDVKAIIVHDKKTTNAFPSIGVVDDTIDLNNETKGINLVGYVEKQDVTFKLYLEANNNSYSYTMRYNMQ